MRLERLWGGGAVCKPQGTLNLNVSSMQSNVMVTWSVTATNPLSVLGVVFIEKDNLFYKYCILHVFCPKTTDRLVCLNS
jgi:hypothetical protein